MRLINRILFIVLAFVVVACGSGGGSGDVTLSVTVNNEEIAWDKSGIFVYINCSGSWTAEVLDSPSWCHLGKEGGEGNGTLTFNVEQNMTKEDRTAVIRIVAGQNVQDIAVLQEAYTGTSSSEGSGNTSGSSQIQSSSMPSGWMELPKEYYPTNTVFVTHNLSTAAGVRNYSMLYDTIQKIARWVAYPMCSYYRGNSGRTDAWGYDPKVPARLQATMFKGISGYQRGHQLPSADRTRDRATNGTTFYFTNMTPQNGTLNTGMWADLENKIRDWMTSCDTIYVVTGAGFNGGSVTYAKDNNGSSVAVPDYYYKALLKRSGETYWAVAYKFDNSAPTTSGLSNYRMSVSDLEALTGFTFFPNLPNANVKKSVDATQWN